MTVRAVRSGARTIRFALAVLLACALGPAHARVAAAGFEIVRTTHGVAHVTASTYAGLGAGTGYAYAQDNLCLLLELALTARGERSRYFGAEGAVPGLPQVTNLEQDMAMRAFLSPQELARQYANTRIEIRHLLRGYVAGVNRYIDDTPASAMDPRCAGKPWLRHLTLDDVHLMTARIARIRTLAFWARALHAAQPPQSSPAASSASLAEHAEASAWRLAAPSIDSGSNGYAFGRASTGGGGLLMANPHLTWDEPFRLYQLHWTLKGRLDVMGVTLAGLPMVVIGFNRDVAWMTPTTSTPRFTLHELKLVPGEPTAYLIDGQARRMHARQIIVDVLQPDGNLRKAARTLWSSHLGPMWVHPGLGARWSADRAYTLRDPNEGNSRLFAHWLRYGQARGVEDIARAAREINGMAWSTTVASDRAGRVMFAESSVTPNLSSERIRACSTSPLAAAAAQAGLLMLDGSRAECDWSDERGAPGPGLVPAERLPLVLRDDYVLNSNNSAWLVHPNAPMPLASPVFGRWNEALRLRARASLAYMREALAAGGARMDPERLKSVLLDNRNYAAELVLPDLLAWCGTADATADAQVRLACEILARWDRRNDTQSRGASLFRETWRTLSRLPAAQLWSTPFDASAPADTPRGLATNDPALRLALAEALRNAVNAHVRAAVAPDSRLGDLQFFTDPRGNRIALHGGEEFEGVLNKMGMSALGPRGYAQPAPANNAGASYLQIVHWSAGGPVADALLVYGQSADVRSPYHFDQLGLYAAKQWYRLPFERTDVLAQSIGQPLHLRVRVDLR